MKRLVLVPVLVTALHDIYHRQLPLFEKLRDRPEILVTELRERG